MSTVRWICAIGLMTLGSIIVGAQETEPGAAPEAVPESAPPAAPAPEAGTSSEAGAAETGEAQPEIVPLDELFIPSEEIAADEEVIFPVNI